MKTKNQKNIKRQFLVAGLILIGIFLVAGFVYGFSIIKFNIGVNEEFTYADTVSGNTYTFQFSGITDSSITGSVVDVVPQIPPTKIGDTKQVIIDDKCFMLTVKEIDATTGEVDIEVDECPDLVLQDLIFVKVEDDQLYYKLILKNDGGIVKIPVTVLFETFDDSGLLEGNETLSYDDLSSGTQTKEGKIKISKSYYNSLLLIAYRIQIDTANAIMESNETNNLEQGFLMKPCILSSDCTLDTGNIYVCKKSICVPCSASTSCPQNYNCKSGECISATLPQVAQVELKYVDNNIVANIVNPPADLGNVHYSWSWSLEDGVALPIATINIPMDEYDAALGAVADVSGNNYNAKIISTAIPATPAYADGVSGKALEFKGAEMLEITNEKINDVLDVKTPFTIELWFKLGTTGEGYLFSNQGTSFQMPQNTFGIYVSGNGLYVGWLTDNEGKVIDIDTGKMVIIKDVKRETWHHLAVEYDPTFNSLEVFYDGKVEDNEKYSVDYAGITFGSLKAPFYLGNNIDGSSPFTGFIDEFRFYEFALTKGQVKLNYNSGIDENKAIYYDKMFAGENLMCWTWGVSALLYDTKGVKINTDELKASLDMNTVCTPKVCISGICQEKPECVKDEECNTAIGELCNEGLCIIPACEKDEDCWENKKCVNSVCALPCTTNEECGEGKECKESSCVSVTSTITTPPTPPSEVAPSGGGGGGGGGAAECIPKFDIKCEAKKKSTPCVEGKKIYYCDTINNCGRRMFSIDCVGFAPTNATCTDKIKNQKERGIDCGGPCSWDNCCDNGMQDEGEKGIDCGGVCTACMEEVKEVAYVAPKEQPKPAPPKTTPKPPVVEEPMYLKILKSWWFYVALALIIGLVVSLIIYTQKHKKLPVGIGGRGSGIPKKEAAAPPPLKAPEEKPIISTAEMSEAEKSKLHSFIKNELSRGLGREEITANLENLGYSKQHINTIFDEEHHNIIPANYEEQLKKYIDYYLKKGESAESIKARLKQKGWSDKLLEKFLK